MRSFLWPLFRFSDANGAPAALARVKFYEGGSATPKPVSNLAGNDVGSEVQLDAQGYYLDGIVLGAGYYKIELWNEADDTMLLPALDNYLMFAPNNAYSSNLVDDYGAEPSADIGALLQTAINDLADGDFGTVFVPGNAATYYLDVSPEIKRNVTVALAPGTRLEIRNDVDGIVIADSGAQLTGGRTVVTKAGYTKSAVKFHPLTVFNRAAVHALINHSIGSTNAGVQAGVALHLLAKARTPGEDNYVEWSHVNNVNISTFETAVRLEAIGNTGELVFCNGNLFDNVTIDRCKRDWVFRCSGDDSVFVQVSGNMINNVQTEADQADVIIDASVAPPAASGSLIIKNVFRNLNVFDYSGSKAFDVGASTRHSQFDIECSGVSRSQYTIDTLYTRVFHYSQLYTYGSHQLPSWSGASILGLNPALFKSETFIENTDDRRYYCDGKFWHGNDGKKVQVDIPEQSMGFDAGSDEILVGATLTGATSGATAEVLEVSVSSGSWDGSDAAGTLYLGAVTSGPFQDDENLTAAPGSGVAVADGANALLTSYTMPVGSLSKGRYYFGDDFADATVREIKLESAAEVGAVFHYQRRNATAPTWINPGTKSIIDPFTGRTGAATEKLALNGAFAEVILECTENKNWVIRSKRSVSNIDFTGANAAPAASVVSEVAGVSYTNNEQDMLNALKTAVNEIQIALDKMRVQDRP